MSAHQQAALILASPSPHVLNGNRDEAVLFLFIIPLWVKGVGASGCDPSPLLSVRNQLLSEKAWTFELYSHTFTWGGGKCLLLNSPIWDWREIGMLNEQEGVWWSVLQLCESCVCVCVCVCVCACACACACVCVCVRLRMHVTAHACMRVTDQGSEIEKKRHPECEMCNPISYDNNERSIPNLLLLKTPVWEAHLTLYFPKPFSSYGGIFCVFGPVLLRL